MAKQDRAVQTRRKIIKAAATVFDREGFQGATITAILKESGVTKGALYFHFHSKEDLAISILAEQSEVAVPAQSVKLQELLDSSFLLAERLRVEPLMRASVRLSLDQRAHALDQGAVFQAWSGHNLLILEKARNQGEVLPHIDLAETADLCVGAFAGLQLMSQAMSDYQDLPRRLAPFQRHLMTGIATPPALASLDFSIERGRRVLEKLLEPSSLAS